MLETEEKTINPSMLNAQVNSNSVDLRLLEFKFWFILAITVYIFDIFHRIR